MKNFIIYLLLADDRNVFCFMRLLYKFYLLEGKSFEVVPPENYVTQKNF